MGAEPVIILIGVARIYYEQIFFVGKLIDKYVVDGAAVIIAYGRIAYPAGRHALDAVRDETLNVAESIFALHHYLAHVRYIEQTHVFTHGPMLVNYRCVLDGERPAAEIDHLSVKRYMRIVKGRFFQRIQF